MGFQLKNLIICTKGYCYCVNNYGEIVVPSLTINIKRGLRKREILSGPTLALVLDAFWSSEYHRTTVI